MKAKRIGLLVRESLNGTLAQIQAQLPRWELVLLDHAEDAWVCPFDALILDPSWPGLDLQAYLSHARQQHPHRVNFLWMETDSQDQANQGFALPPQFLSKSWDREQLISQMQRAFTLADWLEEPALQNLLTKITMARWILQEETQPEAMINAAYTAGFLHDLGQLLFAANFSDTYNPILTRAAIQPQLLWTLEEQTFGVDHPRLAACQMGLWGLPFDIIEAIAWHH